MRQWVVWPEWNHHAVILSVMGDCPHPSRGNDRSSCLHVMLPAPAETRPWKEGVRIWFCYTHKKVFVLANWSLISTPKVDVLLSPHSSMFYGNILVSNLFSKLWAGKRRVYCKSSFLEGKNTVTSFSVIFATCPNFCLSCLAVFHLLPEQIYRVAYVSASYWNGWVPWYVRSPSARCPGSACHNSSTKAMASCQRSNRFCKDHTMMILSLERLFEYGIVMVIYFNKF